MNFTTEFSRETAVGRVKDVPCVEILHGNTSMSVAELLKINTVPYMEWSV